MQICVHFKNSTPLVKIDECIIIICQWFIAQIFNLFNKIKERVIGQDII